MTYYAERIRACLTDDALDWGTQLNCRQRKFSTVPVAVAIVGLIGRWLFSRRKK